MIQGDNRNFAYIYPLSSMAKQIRPSIRIHLYNRDFHHMPTKWVELALRNTLQSMYRAELNHLLVVLRSVEVSRKIGFVQLLGVAVATILDGLETQHNTIYGER